MHYVLIPSKLYRDETYRSICPVIKIVLLGVVPLLSLTYLNWRIFNAVRLSSQLVQEKARNEQQQKENDLARVLIGIIVLFIVCHTFRVTIEIDNIFTARSLPVCHELCLPEFTTLWTVVVDPLSELMMVINSASNMVIYCCLNANFRKLIFPCIERSQRKCSQFLPTLPTQKQSMTTCIEETPLNNRNI